MSIYLEDECSIEIDKKTGRVIMVNERKPMIYGVEMLHNQRHIFGFMRTDGFVRYRIRKRKKTDDFLESLYRLREKDKSKYIMIILDNASIHKAKKVQKYCKEKNIILVYLPPYSPDLNYIEFVWKKVKKRFMLIQWERGTLEEKIRKSIRRLGPQTELASKWSKKSL